MIARLTFEVNAYRLKCFVHGRKRLNGKRRKNMSDNKKQKAKKGKISKQ